ncbi:low affinity potassium transporter [Puccinia graminis f. sp. tritici]|uniref:Potassium transport protein n=2 Tax=Puccinia graminis f. sp. tritici TaxID=56615 RepID=A0A5B0MJW1_PUCGR|nr:low affinity potassium transporter [Puccinia graminis f. sp. tritici]
MQNRPFGSSSSKTPNPTLNDAIQSTESPVDTIEDKIRKLDAELTRYEDSMKNLKEGPEKAAMQQKVMKVLKQKKLYDSQLSQLQQQTFDMEQAYVTTENPRNTFATVDAMKQANKEVPKQPSKIESITSDMEDLIEQANEVQIPSIRPSSRTPPAPLPAPSQLRKSRRTPLLRSLTYWRISPWMRRWIGCDLNFYRCHLLAFIFIPFIFAIIFYLAHNINQSEAQRPLFIDSLFMCHSAMTMTGLNTIPLASLNRFQQALLYILMSIGSTTMISMIMIYIRLMAFKQRFKVILNSSTPLAISHPIPMCGTPPQLKFPENSLDGGPHHRPNLNPSRSVEEVQKLDAAVPETKDAPSNLSALPGDTIEQLTPNLPSPTAHLKSLHQLGLGTIQLVDSPENSPLSVSHHPNRTGQYPRRPAFLRRNSDGGVIGARSSASDIQPALDSSQLGSDALLPILKSSPIIFNNLLSNHLTFEKSTRQNTRANRNGDFFPRSSTLDQPPSFPRNGVSQSHSRDRSLTFALQQAPTNFEHQAVADRGRPLHRRRMGDNVEVSPFSHANSIHPNRCERPSLLPGQLGWIAGTEPEPISPQAEAQTFQQWNPNGVARGVAPESDLDGLRRRIKPIRSIPGTQHHRQQSGSVPAGIHRYIPRQHSISGHSGLAPLCRRRSSLTGLPRTSSTTDFGGFPNPVLVLLKRLGRLLRGSVKESKHSLEFVRTSSLAGPAFDQKERHKLAEWLFGHGAGMISERIQEVKTVSYIKFNAIVGRNSNFLTLTSAQEEELGGLEYRALSMLLKVVIGYWIIFQLVAILILIPYLETPTGNRRFSEVFDGPGGTDRVWYAIWITCSAFTNGGMSLIDAGFTVFHGGYLLMLVCSALIVAGNTGYPIILRAIIWTLSKICPDSTAEEQKKVGGGKKEVLNFLLDHPRRCFVYLFPSRQTWYLFFILLLLTFTDWFFFLILDIGNPKIESIPIGTRIIVGLLQSLSVRAAGFSTISLGDLAPAVQVLFTIMMYIAVYPIAISIRATNVYEERSLGIYHLDEELDQESNEDHEMHADDRGRDGYQTGPSEHPLNLDNLPHSFSSAHDETPNSNITLRNKREKSWISHPHRFSSNLERHHSRLARSENPDALDRQSDSGSRTSAPSYLALHIRKQLAFDIWWLALAVWCICIAERSKIVSAQATDSPSFSIFSIMFEVISAYGTIGLSVGLPDSPTSMVGGFSTFSKLVVIAVMLRGRHRGLPIAIDRAVILPYDKSKPDDHTQPENEELIEDEGEHIRPDESPEIQDGHHSQLFNPKPPDLESQ